MLLVFTLLIASLCTALQPSDGTYFGINTHGGAYNNGVLVPYCPDQQLQLSNVDGANTPTSPMTLSKGSLLVATDAFTKFNASVHIDDDGALYLGGLGGSTGFGTDAEGNLVHDGKDLCEIDGAVYSKPQDPSCKSFKSEVTESINRGSNCNAI